MSTAPEIKRLLAAAWPGVVFDYGTAGRGRTKGLSVGWTGGPSLEGVASTPGCQRTGTMSHTRVAVHFVRRPSPEEHAAEMAAWEAGRPAREAAAQEAIAARRAAGAARRAASRAARIAAEACRDHLAALFPAVTFTMRGAGRLDPMWIILWTDGPSAEEVKSHAPTVADIGFYRQVTYESPAAKQRRDFAESRQMRPARRLARSKARAEAVARGIARRAAGEACFWRPDLHPPGQAWLLSPEAWPVFRRALVGVHAP